MAQATGTLTPQQWEALRSLYAQGGVTPEILGWLERRLGPEVFGALRSQYEAGTLSEGSFRPYVQAAPEGDRVQGVPAYPQPFPAGMIPPAADVWAQTSPGIPLVRYGDTLAPQSPEVGPYTSPPPPATPFGAPAGPSDTAPGTPTSPTDYLGQLLQNRNLALQELQRLQGLWNPSEYINTPQYQTYRNALLAPAQDQLLRDAEKLVGDVPGYSQPIPATNRVGSLDQVFGARGGTRTLEGPYAAAYGQVMAEYNRQRALAEQNATLQAINQGFQAHQAMVNQYATGAGLYAGLPLARQEPQTFDSGAGEGGGGGSAPAGPFPNPFAGLGNPSAPFPWQQLVGAGLAGLPALAGLFRGGSQPRTPNAPIVPTNPVTDPGSTGNIYDNAANDIYVSPPQDLPGLDFMGEG